MRQETGVEILDETLKPQENLGAEFSLPRPRAQPEKPPPAK
jgi:hypothetical protein